MNEELVATIRSEIEKESTDILLQWWLTNDREEWSPEAFEAMKEILLDRGVQLPEQLKHTIDRFRCLIPNLGHLSIQEAMMSAAQLGIDTTDVREAEALIKEDAIVVTCEVLEGLGVDPKKVLTMPFDEIEKVEVFEMPARAQLASFLAVSVRRGVAFAVAMVIIGCLLPYRKVRLLSPGQIALLATLLALGGFVLGTLMSFLKHADYIQRLTSFVFHWSNDQASPILVRTNRAAVVSDSLRAAGLNIRTAQPD